MNLPRSLRVYLTNSPLGMTEVAPLDYHAPLVPIGLAYLAAVIEDACSGGAYSQYVEQRLRGGRPRGYRPTGCVRARDNMRDSFDGEFDESSVLMDVGAFFDSARPENCFIGVSVLSDGMRHARRMLRRLRQRFPRVTLVVGGPHATFFPLDFYERSETREGPLADYVVKNEGEAAILGIVSGDLADHQSLAANARRFAIDSGACDYSDPQYRVIDGGQFGDPGTRIAAFHVLDALPPPAYFVFEDRHGRLPYEPDRRYGLQEPAANMNSSRGCPHMCNFCGVPKLRSGYRTMSPARMADLMQFLSLEYDIRSVIFREDNFVYGGGAVGGDRWHDVETFCELVRDRRLGVRWSIEARADNLIMPARAGSSRVGAMAAAGLAGIYMGVESGSDMMLKLYGKGATSNDMGEAIRAAHGHGVVVVTTACYSDPDLLLKSQYPLIDTESPVYGRELDRQRLAILAETRRFMDEHVVSAECREEYALVGVPVSTIFLLFERERYRYPQLVEYADPETRYLYPKGFAWWAERVYSRRRVRSPYNRAALALQGA